LVSAVLVAVLVPAALVAVPPAFRAADAGLPAFDPPVLAALAGRRADADSRTPASADEPRAGMLAVVGRRVFDEAAATRSPLPD
jgi:hypothetical protein